MSRIFITGSADGLGQLAAQRLIKQGHQVILHARNEARASAAFAQSPGAEAFVAGDLSSINEVITLAEAVNKIGTLDAVIHNAGVGYQEKYRVKTDDGLPQLFAVNSLAPYILTCLIKKPKRLIYISSGLHRSGDASLKDLTWDKRTWNGFNAYADSKLHNVILAFAAARRWPDVYSNAIEPGWVPTKMGGPNAPDSLDKGTETQAWLASSNDPDALVSGHYFYHKKPRDFHPAAADQNIQEQYLQECKRISGVEFPE